MGQAPASKGVARETFVQLRAPAAHLAFGTLTRRPGRAADVLVESIVRKPQRRAFRSLAILHGVAPQDLQRLVVELEARYVAATRADPDDGVPGAPVAAGGKLAKVAFEIDHEKLPEPLFGTLVAFQAAFGPAWLHFEKGHMVARAQALQDPQDAARRLRQALRMAGVKGTVQVVELDGDDLAAWTQLKLWREATANTELDVLLDRPRELDPVRRTGDDD